MDKQLNQRWRLVLGRFANKNLGADILNKQQNQQDKVLEQLYKKQLQRRGMSVSGSLDDSKIQVFNWLDRAAKLFPESVKEQMQHDAVNHFGLTEMLKHKEVLGQLTPNMGLLKQILQVRAQLSPELLVQVRKIIQTVVDELLAQLKPRFEQKLSGRLNRHQRSPRPVLANLDWQRTIRSNLKNFDVAQQQLMVREIYFNSRSKRHIPWRVILCIDQSGSMMDSIIYSAVIAGILTGLPSVELKLVVFDTNIIDLSDKAADPVETLLSVQMGGGTLICQAWQYCQSLAEQPGNTVVATVSDFCEGGSPSQMVAQAKDMMASGIKMLGITAMTADSVAFYDSQMTATLSNEGMEVAALSPDVFADWLAKAMEL